MRVLSPFPEVRLGFNEIAKKSPVKANLHVARRNFLNSAVSVGISPLPASLSIAELGRNVYTNLIANRDLAANASFIASPQEYIKSVYLNDHLAMGLGGVALSAVALAGAFLLATGVRLGIAGVTAIRSPKAPRPLY